MAADTLKVSRKGDTLTTGHICSTTTTLAKPGQDTVFANNIRIARKGDSTVPHPFPPAPVCANHTAVVNAGSETVKVNSKGCGRVGDGISGCTSVAAGSSNVFAG